MPWQCAIWAAFKPLSLPARTPCKLLRRRSMPWLHAPISCATCASKLSLSDSEHLQQQQHCIVASAGRLGSESCYQMFPARTQQSVFNNVHRRAHLPGKR